MLFFTSAEISQLPQARSLAQTLRRYHPDATIYLLLCDRLPADMPLEDRHFDGILYAEDIAITGPISSAYWRFLHTPDALQAACVPLGALTALEQTREEKLVYLSPSTSVPCSLEKLNQLLDIHDIILTPHPLLSIADFDPRQSAYDPGFFAVNFPTIQGTLFLHRWKYAAETLWQTRSDIDELAYNRLMDAVPALFDSCCILQDNYLEQNDDSCVVSYDNQLMTQFKNHYGFYSNGEKIPPADRSRARTDNELKERFGLGCPYNVEESECMYTALHGQMSECIPGQPTVPQEVLPHHFSQKMADLSERLRISGFFRRKPTTNMPTAEQLIEDGSNTD